MNPCPCGYFGTNDCRCEPADVKKYQSKISGPIFDRIDLNVERKRLTTEDRFASAPATEESPRLRQKVEDARRHQAARISGSNVATNAAMPGGRAIELCQFGQAGLAEYRQTVDAYRISTRSMDRLAKVARTVADLEASDFIEPPHVVQAASFVLGTVVQEAF